MSEGNLALTPPMQNIADLVADAIRHTVPDLIENALAPVRAQLLGFVGQREIDLAVERIANQIILNYQAYVTDQLALLNRDRPALPTRDEIHERIDNAVTAAVRDCLLGGQQLMRWRGEFDAEASYRRLDITRHKGAAWIAFARIVGEPGIEGHGWQLLAADGEQGADGPRGARGPRGPVGAQGDPGEPGQAAAPVEHCGLYDPDRTYEPNQIVAHDGQAWWCIEKTDQPPPGAAWRQAVKRGERGRRGLAGPRGHGFNLVGDYNAECEYLPGDVVRHGFASWCARRATQGTMPENDNSGPWQLLCRDGSGST